MPVSTRTRPAGVSMSRQLSAWVSGMVGSELVGHEVLPHDSRDRAQQCPGIAREDTRLDERDGGAGAEVGAPVGIGIDGHGRQG